MVSPLALGHPEWLVLESDPVGGGGEGGRERGEGVRRREGEGEEVRG